MKLLKSADLWSGVLDFGWRVYPPPTPSQPPRLARLILGSGLLVALWNLKKRRKSVYFLFMSPLEPHKAHTCMHHTCHLRLARVHFSIFEKRPKAFYIKQSIFGAPNDRRMNRFGSFFSSDRSFVRASKSRGFEASRSLGGNREANSIFPDFLRFHRFS